MNSKDNITNGFNELLGDITNELNSSKSSKPSNKVEPQDNTQKGTIIFDTVKSEKATTTNVVPDSSDSDVKKYNFVDASSAKSTEPIKAEAQSPRVNQNAAPSSTEVSTPHEIPFQEFHTESTSTSAGNGNKPTKKPPETMSKREEKTTAKNTSKNTKKKRKNKKYGILGSLFKFLLYIIFVVIVSVLLARYIIGVGNDMFAFVKDTYEFSETTYSVKGDTDNSFKVTSSELSGNKFSFKVKFEREFTDREENSMDASVTLINTADNSVAHNYGKFRDCILNETEISIDLSDATMGPGDYLLKLSVNTENGISYIVDFTFSKKVVDIEIEKDASTGDIAKILKKKGIINHPFAFNLYTSFKKGRSASLGEGFVEGTHQLYNGMAYDDIIYAISPRKTYTRSIVKLTFPEGATVDEIIDILIKGGVQNTKEDYIDAINNYDFNYKFIDQLEENGLPYGRVYRLEGYLFPDTYEFYSDASPATVINKFLANFDSKFDDSFYDEAKEMGYTVDEIIRIASLIEMEAGYADDRENISSVFHNRIKSMRGNGAVRFNLLQSDATTDYNSINLDSELNYSKDNKTVSFTIDLSKYNLIDANYYFNYTINTGSTRSVALIHLKKETSESGAVSYKITSKTASDDPVKGAAGNNLQLTVNNASIDGTVFKCELGLKHSFDDAAFKSVNKKLNLFRTEYNTYLTQGIMPSAISNPGYDAITAALYPNSTKYYYFVADKTGKSHFTSTNDEHNAKIRELQRNNMSVTTN